MILCDNCGRENQDHYKFCLGCGAELKREAAQPKRFTEPTPPAGVPAAAPATAAPPAHGMPAFGGAPVRAPREPAVPAARAQPSREAAFAPTAAIPAAGPAPGAAARSPSIPAAAETIDCPSCGQTNPRNFKFCGACGFNLKEWLERGAPPLSSGTSTGGASPSAAPRAPAAPAAVASGAGAALVVIRPDGSEGERLRIEGSLVVGRETGGAFAQDTYLSPRHARFETSPGGVTITDEGTLNGVYVRLEREVPRELGDGDVFRIGQEIIRFERIAEPAPDADGVEPMGGPNPDYLGRICLVVGRETVANCFCVPADGLHLGRERGDIVFPDDGYVSGLHCRIHGEGGRVFLTDVGSSNGTFFRVEGREQVPPGTLVLMGQQLFRVDA